MRTGGGNGAKSESMPVLAGRILFLVCGILPCRSNGAPSMKTAFAPIKIAFMTLVAMLALTGCGGAAPAGNPANSLINRSDTIKSAYMRMQGADVTSVRNKVYANLEAFGAEVTSESWADEYNVRYNGSMSLRVPSANFLRMIDWMKENFKFQSLDLSARVATEGDTKSGDVSKGVAYSTIYLQFEKSMGFGDSFAIGLGRAGDALRSSLESVVPVVVFLFPYAIIVWLFIELIRVIRRAIKRAVNKARPQAPEKQA